MLFQKNEDIFTVWDGVELKFERDDKNQIIGLNVNAGRVTNLRFKRK